MAFMKVPHISVLTCPPPHIVDLKLLLTKTLSNCIFFSEYLEKMRFFFLMHLFIDICTVNFQILVSFQ